MKVFFLLFFLSIYSIIFADPPSSSPILMVDSVTTTSITWKFVDMSNNEDGFRVYDGMTGVLVLTLSPSNPYTATNVTFPFTETNLKPNTIYKREVRAWNNDGEASSGIVSVSTLANPPTSLTQVSERIGAYSIVISWQPGQGGNKCFHIERAVDIMGGPGPWEVLKKFEDNYTSTIFRDTGLTKGLTYWYRVAGYNHDGVKTSYSNVISVGTMETIKEPRIVNNLISPSTSSFCEIQFEMATSGNVQIKVYTTSGELVATLVNEFREGGKAYSEKWEAKNDKGTKVASGMYYILIKTPDGTYVKKVVVAK
jgi:hypothetical protein